MEIVSEMSFWYKYLKFIAIILKIKYPKAIHLMEANQEILKIISNETINSLSSTDIITPTIYKSFFAKHAGLHHIEIMDEEKITNNLLDAKILMCENFQDKNSKNAIELSDHTTKAISAIESKDEQKLNEVLRETKLLKQEIEKLKEAVYRDELTHAYNRKWLHDTFLENGDSDKFKENGTLAILDLNYFKEVNDTYGHIVGDKVLIFIANKLRKTNENIIRYGGDEFIIIFPAKTSKEVALIKLNRIRDEIISKKLKANESSFRVSFSFGAYQFKQGEELSDVINLADKDMYEDKVQIKKIVTGI